MILTSARIGSIRLQYSHDIAVYKYLLSQRRNTVDVYMIAVRLHDVFSLKSNIYIGLFHERFVRNSRNREAMSFLPFPSLIFGTTEPISIVFGVRSLNADESMKLIKQFRNSYGI